MNYRLYRNKRVVSSHFSIALLDQYIGKELMPSFIFSLIICTIICELVGISFEQIRFVVEEGLPVSIAVYVHWLKLPAFICVASPFALFTATIIVYTKLSTKNEIVALQSFGISLYRLIIPSLLFACVMTANVFIFHELIVPSANYKAAMILEREWEVDRTKLAKYNQKEIIYQEFEVNQHQNHLRLLFFAENFDGTKLRGITLLKYQNQKIRQIIIARSAQWNERLKQWQLFSGSLNKLSTQGTIVSTNNFENLTFKLTRNILDYANHYLDNREMNIIDLYHRLAVVKPTKNSKKIRELQTSIQERYATPVSCLVFTFLGSALGISAKSKANQNSLGMAAITSLCYYFTQFLSTTLIVAEVISVFLGVWFPNLLDLSISCLILKITQQGNVG